MSMSPLLVRVLRDAVVVIVFIVLGEWVARLPYATASADPIMIELFRAVFGTLGFAATGYFAVSRRPLHMALTFLAVWLLAGLAIALGGGDPSGWIIMLVFLPLMALLGGGLALLIERLARE